MIDPSVFQPPWAMSSLSASPGQFDAPLDRKFRGVESAPCRLRTSLIQVRFLWTLGPPLRNSREALSPVLVFGRRRVAAMERFDFRLFSRTKDRPPPGTYAMWWVTPEDSNLRSSPTIASIDRVYQAVHGYASCFLALILEALGTAHPGETRVPLPKTPLSPLWRGPELP